MAHNYGSHGRYDTVARGGRPVEQTAADEVRAFLAGGGVLSEVRTPVNPLMDPGEYVVGYFTSGLRYARYYGTPVHYPRQGASVWIGSPRFVAGVLFGAVAAGIVRQGRARRAAAPQWHSRTLLQTVVTTRRLWCELHLPTGRKWTRLGYDAITEMNWRHGGLEIRFRDSEALRLTGAHARWCEAVIAHYCNEMAAGGSATGLVVR